MKVLILASGGDAPGMNRFIAKIARAFKDGAFGVKAGFRGLIDGDVKPLSQFNPLAVENEAGSCIFSSRCLEFQTEEGFNKGLQTAKKYDVTIVIGGNGSFKGAKQLAQNGVRTIFVPGTIDNDVTISEYSIGFHTAVKACCDYYYNTMPSMQAFRRCGIFIVMGRYHDAIARNCAKAVDADLLFTDSIDYDKIIEVSKRNYENDRATGVILREKIATEAEITETLKKKAPDLDFKLLKVGHLQRGSKPTRAELKMVDGLARACIKGIKSTNDSFACVYKEGRVETISY